MKDEVSIKLSRIDYGCIELRSLPFNQESARERLGTRGALNGVDNRARARERDNDFRPVRGRRRR